MLNSGKKIRALCDKKNKYSKFTCCSLQVKWSVPKDIVLKWKKDFLDFEYTV